MTSRRQTILLVALGLALCVLSLFIGLCLLVLALPPSPGGLRLDP